MKRRLGIGSNVKAAKLTAGAEPVWNELMPAGEWHRSDWGVIKCDRALFEAFIANWKAKGSPELPIDRHHWGSSNETRVTDPKAKAAVGWIQDFRIGASGNLEGLTKWLPEGKADIDAERFKYISPEFHEAWLDAATGEPTPTIFGASLLNDPYFLGHLPALAANDSPQSKEHLMNREELIKLYGLPASATDADIRAAAQAGAEARKAAADAETKRKASETRTGELEVELRQTKERAESTEKRLAQVEADAKEAKVKADSDALCAKLEREGRIVAAQKVDVAHDVRTSGIEKATERWNRAPVIVKLGESGHGGGGDPNQADALKQFEAKVAEIEKTGVDARSAHRAAAKANPELFRAAFSTTNRASA